MKNKVILVILLGIHLFGYTNNRAYYDTLLNSYRKEVDNHNYTNYAKMMEDLMRAKVYAKEYNLYDMQARALNLMGLVYTEMLSYDKAIESYLEAYQIASKLPDKKSEIRLLNNIGQLYFLSNNVDKAKEYAEQAYKIAVKRKDNFGVMVILHNLIIGSNQKKNVEQSEKYLRIAMERIKQFPKDPHIIHIKEAKAEYLYLKKEYNLAEQLALEALNQNKGQHKSLEADCWFLLSKIYNQKKNYSKATLYAKEALRNSANLPITIEIYAHLSTIYHTIHSPSLAWQYQDSVMMLKDSLLQLNTMNHILRGQIQFDLNNMEKTLLENKAKQKRNQLIFALIIVFSLTLFLLILYINITKSRQFKKIVALELEKEKNEKLILEQYSKEQEILALLEQERANNEIKEKKLLRQQLKEQETLARLEQRIYRNEIKMKNKQLVSKTLFQLNKNEMIGEIIHTLSLIPKQLEIPELKPIIQKLKSQLKEPSAWKSFLTYFEQINPDFLSNLKEKHTDLVAADIRLASYIYLDLDTKEIAKLLNITPEYCRKKKQRLAQKLGLPSVKIYSYLAGIV